MTKLDNLRAAREALRASMHRVDERRAEISAQFTNSPCCPDCGARNGSEEYVRLIERQDRQRQQLDALEAKIYREAGRGQYLLSVFARVISGDVTPEELAGRVAPIALQEALVELSLSLYAIGREREQRRPYFEREAKRTPYLALLRQIADHPALPPAARPAFLAAWERRKALLPGPASIADAQGDTP